MRLLISGATGFLGSRITTVAVEAGHNVVALVRASSSLAKLAHVRDEISLALIDTQPGDLGGVVRSVGEIDAVVHAAGTYGRNGTRTSTIVGTNVLFGLELFEAAAPHVSAFVNIGTALPERVSPYAASKRQFSAWALAAAHRENWPFADLAVELMYGPGDDDFTLVASLVLACLRGDDRMALTAATQERDLVYVDDVAAAALLACAAGMSETSPRRFQVRVGSGIAIRVRAVAEAIRHATGARTAMDFGALPFREHEVMRSVADGSATALLGWRPGVTFEEGLRRTIAWYQHSLTVESPT